MIFELKFKDETATCIDSHDILWRIDYRGVGSTVWETVADRVNHMDEVYFRRRKRKMITCSMISRLLQDMGYYLEGDSFPVGIPIKRTQAFLIRAKLDESEFAVYIGTTLHLSQGHSERSGYKLNPVAQLKKKTYNRRPRKMMTNGLIRTLVTRLGGRLV